MKIVVSSNNKTFWMKMRMIKKEKTISKTKKPENFWTTSANAVPIANKS